MEPVSSALRARAQGAFRTPDGTVVWRVWAPRHATVRLVLGLGDDRRLVPLQADDNGYFSVELGDVAEGTRYAYQLGDSHQNFPDPASRWQPDGVHHPSAVLIPEAYVWRDQAWPGVTMRDLVIYELHVGTFTPAGTFQAIVPRLRELRELGVTAIELMPIAQFPGGRNWGYDGVHPYAAQNSYGGPHGLRVLVDAAHAAGLGVLLDVVYNHLGPEGNYLDGFGPYFTSWHHTPWGVALNYDGPDSDPVRQFVIDNACQWIRDFHLDGLRLDAVQTIYDNSAYHLLAELQVAVQRTALACGRSAVVIAETNQNDERLTAPLAERGYGLDGVWSDDFHHAVHAVLTGERDGYYVDFGEPEQLAKAYREPFVFDGCYSRFRRHRQGSRVRGQPRERFVVCVQNHDQVGNRARGERLDELISPAAERLAAALLLLSPGTPLLFMGQEYGETRRFPFFCSFGDPALNEAVRQGRRREFAELAFHWRSDIPDAHELSTFEAARITWQWQDDVQRAGLRELYRVLLAARRSWPRLIDRQRCDARWSTTEDGRPLLEILRGAVPEQLVAVANLSDAPVELPGGYPPLAAPRLSTEEARFGGCRVAGQHFTRLEAYELIIADDSGG